MSAERTPKVGEVWTDKSGVVAYTCIVDEADADGEYVWTYQDDDGRRYDIIGVRWLTPPTPLGVLNVLTVERVPR